jgi:hypothetical protein
LPPVPPLEGGSSPPLELELQATPQVNASTTPTHTKNGCFDKRKIR